MNSISKVILVNLCNIFLVTACSKDLPGQLEGKWAEIDGTETMEFLENGSLLVTDGGSTLTGSFSELDESRIKIQMDGLMAMAGVIVVNISFEGDELVFTMPDGEVSRYLPEGKASTKSASSSSNLLGDAKAKNTVVGTWKGNDGGKIFYYSFSEDGAFSIIADEKEKNFGTYTLEGNEIVVVENGKSQSDAQRVVFSVKDAVLSIVAGADSLEMTRENASPRPTSGNTQQAGSRTRATDEVIEGLSLSGGAKAAVTEFYQDKGRVPNSSAEAGLPRADSISGKYVSSVDVDAGLIIVTYGNEASRNIRGKQLVMRPYASNGRLMWQCGLRPAPQGAMPAFNSAAAKRHATTVPPENLPPACR